jgi:hypothetical protein
MRILIHTLCIVVLLPGLSFGQSKLHHSKADIYCKECHSCEKPTERDPCLICCPEFTRKGITTRHPVEMAPEIVTIDVISKLYEPSVFSHRKHADHADMSDGCILCHHYNPPGEVATCRDCHKSDRQRTNLRKPDLLAAYHRQCLGCHMTWRHENDCLSCHAKKGEGVEQQAAAAHEGVAAPVKEVYETDFEDGRIVTFYHDDHVKMYNLACSDCHMDQSCASCHDVTGKTAAPETEPHENCIDCHAEDVEEGCDKCHAEEEKAPFDHAVSTGWPLKTYHSALTCAACHGKSGKFTKLQRNCSACHKAWDAETFDHKVTGFELDEMHREFECESCHMDDSFIETPECSACHDEDFTYPDAEPGMKIKN